MRFLLDEWREMRWAYGSICAGIILGCYLLGLCVLGYLLAKVVM